MTTNDDAIDASRFRFIRDVLAHMVEWDQEGRVTVKFHDAKARFSKNSTHRLRSAGEVLPLAIDALMGIVPTPEPEDRSIPMPPCAPNRAPDGSADIVNKFNNKEHFVFGPVDELPRSGMSDEERELLRHMAKIVIPLTRLSEEDRRRGFPEAPDRTRLRQLLESIKP